MAEILFSAWGDVDDGEIPLDGGEFDMPDFNALPGLIDALSCADDPAHDVFEQLRGYSIQDIAERDDVWTSLLRALSFRLNQSASDTTVDVAFAYAESVALTLIEGLHPSGLSVLLVLLSNAPGRLLDRCVCVLDRYMSERSLVASAGDDDIDALVAHVNNLLFLPQTRGPASSPPVSSCLMRLLSIFNVRHKVLRTFHFTGAVTAVQATLRRITQEAPAPFGFLGDTESVHSAEYQWRELSASARTLCDICAFTEGVDVVLVAAGPVSCACMATTGAKMDGRPWLSPVAPVPSRTEASPFIFVKARPAPEWNGRVRVLTVCDETPPGTSAHEGNEGGAQALRLRVTALARRERQSFGQACAGLLAVLASTVSKAELLAPAVPGLAPGELAAVMASLGRTMASVHGLQLKEVLLLREQRWDACALCVSAWVDSWQWTGALLRPVSGLFRAAATANSQTRTWAAQVYLQTLTATLGRGNMRHGSSLLGAAVGASAVGGASDSCTTAVRTWLEALGGLACEAGMAVQMHAEDCGRRGVDDRAGNAAIAMLARYFCGLLNGASGGGPLRRADLPLANLTCSLVATQSVTLCGPVISALRAMLSLGAAAARPVLAPLALLMQPLLQDPDAVSPATRATIGAFAPAAARLCAEGLAAEYLSVRHPALLPQVTAAPRAPDDSTGGLHAMALTAAECTHSLTVLAGLRLTTRSDGSAVTPAEAAASSFASSLLLALRSSGILGEGGITGEAQLVPEGPLLCSPCAEWAARLPPVSWAAGVTAHSASARVDGSALAGALVSMLQPLAAEGTEGTGPGPVAAGPGPASGGGGLPSLASFIWAALGVHPEITRALLGVASTGGVQPAGAATAAAASQLQGGGPGAALGTLHALLRHAERGDGPGAEAVAVLRAVSSVGRACLARFEQGPPQLYF